MEDSTSVAARGHRHLTARTKIYAHMFKPPAMPAIFNPRLKKQQHDTLSKVNSNLQ